ncbi:MAG: Bacterial alpha-L-rhamnosidase [Pseudomonadales bacterium]|nr:Bacterial alpha-L-rhamnosidase [Pseudomonadales bacterium]
MTHAPITLRADGCVDPLGLSGHPQLAWWVDDDRTAEIQSAYEIHAASSESLLVAEDPDLWRSGVVPDGRSASVPYAGLALVSEQKVWWRVRTYDSDGLASAWSDAAHFEMGLLGEDEWTADWISPFVHGNRFMGSAVARLFCDVELPEVCARARLHVGVVGACQISINDVSVTPEPVASWADYSTYHYCQILDVSEQLVSGTNQLEILLADGYASGALPGLGREVFSERPAVRCMLIVEGNSTRRYEFTTNRTWSWLPSAIADAQTLVGEHMGGRRRVDDWIGAEVGRLPVQVLSLDSHPIYDVRPLVLQETELLAQPTRRFAQPQPSGPPLMICEYDAGRIVCGAVELELVGRETDGIEIIYSIDRAFKGTTKDTITTSGSRSGETYGAQFARHYFRYVRIRYTQGLTLPGNVHLCIQRSRKFFSSRIETDNEDFNAMLRAIDVSHDMAIASAPLHGAESAQRLPDFGITSTWVPELVWDPSLDNLINKWLEDARQGFRRYTNSAPYSGGRMPMPRDDDELARFESLTTIIWHRYCVGRDPVGLRACYSELRALALGARHLVENGLRTQCREDIYGEGADGSFVANCTLLFALRMFVQIADLLEEKDDVTLTNRVIFDLTSSFANRYLSANGRLVHETQATLLGALTSGCLSDVEQTRVESELAVALQNADFRVDLPQVLIKQLLPHLSDSGRNDLAYRVLLNPHPTSWLGFVRRDLGLIGRSDRAAVAESGILAWVMRYLVGLNVPLETGESTDGRYSVSIAPKPPLGPLFAKPPGARIGIPIQAVSCALPTPCGQISIRWLVSAERFELTVRLPVNCIAEVTMPDGECRPLSSGLHSLAMDFSRGADGVPTLLNSAEAN